MVEEPCLPGPIIFVPAGLWERVLGAGSGGWQAGRLGEAEQALRRRGGWRCRCRCKPSLPSFFSAFSFLSSRREPLQAQQTMSQAGEAHHAATKPFPSAHPVVYGPVFVGALT